MRRMSQDRTWDLRWLPYSCHSAYKTISSILVEMKHWIIMQRTSVYSFAILTVVYIMIGGACLVGALSEGHAAIPWPPVIAHILQVDETDTALPEFEGRYKVGPTTCTVKPIRMAFEVRWAKGKGVMRFFFDRMTPEGKAIFVSEDVGKGTDKFIFDDNRYNSGTFLRADGRMFTVKRTR